MAKYFYRYEVGTSKIEEVGWSPKNGLRFAAIFTPVKRKSGGTFNYRSKAEAQKKAAELSAKYGREFVVKGYRVYESESAETV